MHERDVRQRFVFEGVPVRGEIVHLDATWQTVLSRHDYPEPIRKLLGEVMVAGALLSSTLKFDGSLILQIQGDGPLTMLVVESTSDRTLRALARWSGEVPEAGLERQTGEGKLVITLDPKTGSRRYQSIVPLGGDSVAALLETYLAQSEQVATRLWIASDREVAAGILLQRLPDEEIDDDAWDKVVCLADTVRGNELLDLPATELLYRLYHQEDIRMFEPEPISFRCTCSRERVRNMLRGLGHEEVAALIEEHGKVAVDCEFCNQHFEFDGVDVEMAFAAENQPNVPPTRH